MCVYYLGWSLMSLGPFVNWFRYFCMVVAFVQAFLMTCLNFYWYRFLLKKLSRAFKSKSSNKDSDDDFKKQGKNLDDDYAMNDEEL